MRVGLCSPVPTERALRAVPHQGHSDDPADMTVHESGYDSVSPHNALAAVQQRPDTQGL